MKKTLYTLLIILLVQRLFAQENRTIYHRAKVQLQQKDIKPLQQLGVEMDHGVFYPGKYLINDFSEAEINLIKAADYEVEILIEDMVRFYQSGNRDASLDFRGPDDCNNSTIRDYQVPANFQLGSMAGFFTYAEMLAELDQMRIKYPDLITAREPIGTNLTPEGNRLYSLKISDNPEVDEAEPEVLYTALHHAREPNSLSQLIFYMWYLLENYDKDDEIRYLLDHTEMYFIPCVNPDGYLFNQEIEPDGGGLWRKNRRVLPDGFTGVDLNRNYGFQWGFDNSGSSPNPQSDVYRGTAPFSEMETRTVRDFCEDHDFRVAMNHHTYGKLIVYPWGYSDTLTQDAAVFSNWSELYALQNNFLAGTGTETVGYTVNGDADDWMYGAREIIAMTPEVGGGGQDGGFWPDLDQIIPNCKASVWMNLSAARVVHRFGFARDIGPRMMSIETPYIQYALKRYGLENGPLEVGVKPLSPKIVMVDGRKTYNDLSLYEEVEDQMAWQLQGDIREGEIVAFELSVDNGNFSVKDTIEKIIHLHPSAYSDNLNSVDTWILDDSWGLTGQDFVSGPTSMTDSPSGNYASDATQILETKNYFSVPSELSTAYLNFWAKWVTESDFDFVQVQISVNQADYIPLCGQYTEPGSPNQKEGEPVYDGAQLAWVNENIPLTDYLMPGDSFKIRFELISDRFINMDGFYFDDLNVFFFSEDTINAIPINDNAFSISVFPNPTKDKINIEWKGPTNGASPLPLQIYDVSGRLLHQAQDWLPETPYTLPVGHWPPGLYLGQLSSREGIRHFKFVVSDGL